MSRAEQLQVALIGAVSAIESLRDRHASTLGDTRILLQGLTDNVEKTFRWLGTSVTQEEAIDQTMNESVEQILHLLSTRGKYDEEFDHVLDALRGSEQAGELELW